MIQKPFVESSKAVLTQDALRMKLFGETADAAPTTSTDECAVPKQLLEKFTITGESDTLALQLTDDFLVLECLAARGQWTVIYSAPNTGKTLLSLHLISRTLRDNPEISKNYFYINADDNLRGIVEKTKIAEEFAFNIIVPGYKGFETHRLPILLAELCHSKQASHAIIVIDTLKKAVDLMKKSRLREFGEIVRRFISMGGTLVALAHTNKKKGVDGNPIPEGTGDIINDADCVYVMDEVGRDNECKTIQLTNIKSRGSSEPKLFFRYSTDPSLDYQQRLASVERINESEVGEFVKTPEEKSENQIVHAICESIESGINSKMRIRDHASELCGASRRQVLTVLEKFTGTDVTEHRWNYVRGPRGLQTYSLNAEFQISRSTENSEEIA
ncbi:MAG: hypothetical protein R3332_05970 [Pseudohongiellaceae bacterium]|nr:hypothetical protein [Pseudohongiellaceae bacterium]